MSKVVQDHEVTLLPFSLVICLWIFWLILLLSKKGEKKKKGCKNPYNDDIQGVMIRLVGCGGLWQMRLNLG